MPEKILLIINNVGGLSAENGLENLRTMEKNK